MKTLGLALLVVLAGVTEIARYGSSESTSNETTVTTETSVLGIRKTILPADLGADQVSNYESAVKDVQAEIAGDANDKFEFDHMPPVYHPAPSAAASAQGGQEQECQQSMQYAL